MLGTITTNDCTIAYKQIGNLESEYTLLFIHGSTMTKEGMLPIAAYFKDYNCILLDLPAHGESTGKIPVDVEGYGKEVEKIIQELLRQKKISNHLTILGYSMGGAITYELVIRNNVTVDRMVILSSGADLKSNTPLVDELILEGIEKFDVQKFFLHAFGLNTTEEEKKLILEILGKTKVDDEVGFADLVISNKYDKLDQAEHIQIPTMIIHGNDDEIVLPFSSLHLREKIKNSVIVMIPYRGHTAIFEETPFVIEKIEDFFGKNM